MFRDGSRAISARSAATSQGLPTKAKRRPSAFSSASRASGAEGAKLEEVFLQLTAEDPGQPEAGPTG